MSLSLLCIYVQLPLSAFPPEQIEQLVAKVERIYAGERCSLCPPHIVSSATSCSLSLPVPCPADHCPAMEELVLEHPALACDLTDKRNGPSALKHIKQQVSGSLSSQSCVRTFLSVCPRLPS